VVLGGQAGGIGVVLFALAFSWVYTMSYNEEFDKKYMSTETLANALPNVHCTFTQIVVTYLLHGAESFLRS
jgi:hypothetical protein